MILLVMNLLFVLMAVPVLGAVFILGRINSSPRPRRSRKYASVGAREPPSWLAS